MRASTSLEADIAAIGREFETLRERMTDLVDEIKRAAKHRAQGAADPLEGSTHGLFDGASDQGECSANGAGIKGSRPC